MDASTVYNEIVYLIKKHSLDMTQVEYENWLDSGGLLYWCNELTRTKRQYVSSDDEVLMSNWLVKFVDNCKISRKLNLNFKEIV